MAPAVRFTASPEESGQRADQFLKKHLKEFSRSQIQRWMKTGSILCGGKSVSPSYALKAGDIFSYSPPQEEISVIPQSIPLKILYEDKSILAIDKPVGMMTHPAGKNLTGTLANAVAYHIKSSSLSFPPRLGIVHRLDRDTSGVLIVAKNSRALENLAHQFRERKVKKIYRAIVCGKVPSFRGSIEAPIGGDFQKRRMTVTPTGKFSRTEFKVLKSFGSYSYLEAYPKTGRTHQIRVHLAKIGIPVLGDEIYGSVVPANAKQRNQAGIQSLSAPRQMLHAYQIEFQHPATKKIMKLTAPLPKDFQEALKYLRRHWAG